MADSPFELSVDDDWKKQAQAEKRRLAEEAETKKAAPASAATTATPAAASPNAAGSRRRRPARGDLPDASFESLVDLLAQQVRLYLGGVAVSANGEGIVDLDAARRNLDLLAILESKTAGNVSDDERSALDVALYEARSRFSAVAARYIL